MDTTEVCLCNHIFILTNANWAVRVITPYFQPVSWTLLRNNWPNLHPVSFAFQLLDPKHIQPASRNRLSWRKFIASGVMCDSNLNFHRAWFVDKVSKYSFILNELCENVEWSILVLHDCAIWIRSFLFLRLIFALTNLLNWCLVNAAISLTPNSVRKGWQ